MSKFCINNVEWYIVKPEPIAKSAPIQRFFIVCSAKDLIKVELILIGIISRNQYHCGAA